LSCDPCGGDRPGRFLGRDHAEAYGDSPALLVKLLHAGERLPVHCHPDRDFARRHLDCPWGKTEAWVVADTEGPDPVVHLGFREAMDPGRLAELVAGQQVEPLLASLNTVPVAAGDTVLVPAGLPHAIGQGVLLAELQEPTDLSVLLEWEDFAIDGRRDGHLGLGFELALGRHGYRDSLSRCGRERPGGLFLRNQRVGRAQFGHLVAAGIGRGDRDAVLAAIGLHGFMAGWP
jgi:hypothetical protein